MTDLHQEVCLWKHTEKGTWRRTNKHIPLCTLVTVCLLRRGSERRINSERLCFLLVKWMIVSISGEKKDLKRKFVPCVCVYVLACVWFWVEWGCVGQWGITKIPLWVRQTTILQNSWFSASEPSGPLREREREIEGERNKDIDSEMRGRERADWCPWLCVSLRPAENRSEHWSDYSRSLLIVF